tara:strand:+ start:209 stop:682 length:474 start_codon:yes stop_codon:yes gene_type:complete
MNVTVDLINDSEIQTTIDSNEMQNWVVTTLKSIKVDSDISICIKLVDLKEAAELNLKYRKKDEATNVLSFSSVMPNSLYCMLPVRHLGDVVICPEIVKNEAAEQRKSEIAHYAHLIIHGTLHLNGFRHKTKNDAKNMEKEEIKILEKLGFPNPYLVG